jgi:transcriptional regulator with XRE-family HTH domain
VDGMDLKSVREKSGLTQIQFAEQLGVHPVSLSRFERNAERITLTVELAVYELARRLGAESALPPEVERKPKKLKQAHATKK